MKESFLKGGRVKVLLLVIFALFVCKKGLFAQNTVGIGTASPNTNAVLELVSPSGNQGVLLPRVSTLQRQAMTGSLSAVENGLIVFDTDLNLFFHWVDSAWVTGLGSFSNVAGGDLQGTYPDPTLRDDAVNSAKVTDGSLETADLADDAVTAQKINSEGNSNSVLGTDAAGNPQWEPKGNFLGNSLADGTILIGDATDAAQSRSLSGDIALTNDGTTTINDNTITSAKIVDNTITDSDIGTDAVDSDEIAAGAVTTVEILDNTVGNVDLADDAVTSAKIADATISAADIGTDAVGNDEIASGAVASDEIADGTVGNADLATNSVNSTTIADGSVITDDIASGGNNKVLITTGAGTVFWENISLFETSTLPEGNVFVGDVTNTAAPLNARGSGRILIGDGVSVQSLNVTGDINLASNGDAQLNPDVVGSSEIIDNSLTKDDIGPDAVEASELADNSVDTGAIQSNAVTTAKINDDAITTAKIDGGGNNNAVLSTDGSGNPQWEDKSSLDTDPTNELNTGANLTGTDLNITDAGGTLTVDLNSLVDDADADPTNEIQDLDAVLTQGNDAGGNAITNAADPTGAQDLATKNYVDSQSNDDADADPTNELNTGANLTGTDLNITDAGGTLTVDLNSLVDDADADPTNEIQDLDAVLTQGNDAGGNAITNAADPTGAQDLATKNYVDSQSNDDADADPTNELNTGANLTGTDLNITDAGGTLTVDLNSLVDDADADPTNEIQDLDAVLTQGNDAGGNAITNAADPTGAQDLATKNYVDSQSNDDADADPTNELNTGANLTGTDLNITDAGGTLTVDLNSLVDDADADPTNEIQDLDAVLTQGNDAGGNAITNAADPTGAQDLATKNYVDSQSNDDADADPTNELNTGANLTGTDLNITDAGGTLTVDLNSLVDDADADPTNEIQDLDAVLTQGNDAGGNAIANVADPTNAQDAATKNYVDSQASGVDEVSELIDVDLTGLADGQVLKWNQTNSQWEPANDSGSSGSTSYYAIDVSDFQGSENSILDVRLSGTNAIAAYLRGPTGKGDLIAPIHLPDGAEITSVTMFFHDSDGSEDVDVWLYRQTYGGTITTTLASGGSTGTPGNTNISITPLSIPFGTVNNNLYTYRLRIELGYYNTSTFASILNKVYGVRITYTN